MQEQQGRPLVSVVMATYNGERFLDEQLRSIRNQTWTNLEIIVVDDASTDGTVDILRRHAMQDGRIQIHVSASNQGTTGSFETGFALAQGEFVAISDQDDIWLPEKIAVLLDRIKDHDAIYTDSELIGGDGRPLGISLLQKLGIDSPASGRDFFQLLCRNCVSGHAMLLRRSLATIALPLNREEGFVYDQQLAALAMLNAGLAFYERPLTLHRIHEGNQVNRLMKSSASRRGDRCERREARRLRYMRMQKQLLGNIALLQSHVKHYSERYEQDVILLQAMSDLNRLHDYLAKLGDCRFSMPLFWLFFRQRRRLFCFSRKHPVFLCGGLARGYGI